MSELQLSGNDWYFTTYHIPHALKAQRGRKGRKREREALRHGQENIAAHRTRNGRGCVARLMAKR